MRPATWLTAAWLLLAACSGGEQDGARTTKRVVDSTGTEFVMSCDSYWCDLRLARGQDCGDQAELMGARFLVACTGQDDFIYVQNCRALTCAEDGDCAQFSDLPYACRDGVCEASDWDEDFAAGREELYALCALEVARRDFCKRSPLNDPADPPDRPINQLVDENCGTSECAAIPAQCAP